ncbi:ribosomal protein S18 acetylase RimI-like enzyme [Chromobacterium alkanivorans]|uniref:GNAT family N-acetyltransferase n=1 Tax=Chromobacterium alkanivorans TaxID=1071719 RepID=UPI0021693876|nr:GNAT family N-acetyltransferase [Chromobacterium alkanivorans]MCS3805874.1 ribosomal protein S18 acetylase RimI-like enzyme [Chromobacterium alkanivorans]MCS3820212.1 ribosomal protein S18 acetylase RimI-like enzyme [Chromobacterium alkanivorans]MCS3874970.1 ribosomal protein S18 acetylase RimI-like enzyme [Chromobacterium alkanivorans]
MRLHSLSLIDFPLIHRAFALAFSDYLLPMRMDEEQLAAMLHRRGWRPELSVGAWRDGALVGLWLAGVHCDEVGPIGYCIATGVTPDARRQGLLQAMAAATEQRLASRGIQRQRLEVIADNAAAMAAYLRLGFRPHRRLDCYRIEHALAVDAAPGWRCEAADLSQWPRWPLHSEPAVPNSRDSLERARPPLQLLTATRNGEVLGYALHSAAGDVAELAVATPHRRRGVARSLLAAVQRQTSAPALAVSNLDADDLAGAALLRSCGAGLWLSQWEMRRP